MEITENLDKVVGGYVLYNNGMYEIHDNEDGRLISKYDDQLMAEYADKIYHESKMSDPGIAPSYPEPMHPPVKGL